MKSARATTPGASRYLSSGPIVWVATMVCTTLLLVALKQALWLVVPFLLAIILYYALFPAVRRLTLAGIERETAAAIVAGGSLVAAVAALVPTLPWLAAQAVSGQEALFRYLAGGQAPRRTIARDARVAVPVPEGPRLPRRDEPEDGGFRRHLREGASRGRRCSERPPGCPPSCSRPSSRSSSCATAGGSSSISPKRCRMPTSSARST